MLAQSLEQTLNRMFQAARSANSEFVTAEHLLLGLLDDTQCRELLLSLDADLEELASTLKTHIDSSAGSASAAPIDSVQPTLGFQRALQRAVFHVQCSGKKEVSAINVLVSLLAERESKAASVLAEQGIDRQAVLRHLGESDWGEVSANLSVTPQIVGHSGSARVFAATMSNSNIEKRLDELEKKLDVALGEVRDLSVAVRQLLER